MAQSVRLEQADKEDLTYIESLLDQNDLPFRDVRSKPESFYVAHNGNDRVGVGGLEVHRPFGLLRSVVVDQSNRDSGLGTAICCSLESTAVSDGIHTLYLLTTTAKTFFDGLQYQEIPQSDAPTPIQETTEFAELCPSTATCMKKSL